MKKALWLIITGLLSGLAITASWIVPFYLVWSIVFTVSTAITYLFYLITELLNHKARKLALFSNILVLSIVSLFTIFYYTGLLSHFSSLEEARKWFESFGIWAWLIFFIIQILYPSHYTISESFKYHFRAADYLTAILPYFDMKLI